MVELEQTFANDSLQKFLLLLPLLNRIDSILSFCRTIIFMVLPVLVLPQIFKMDGEWLSISAGEMLSLAMSIYYFVKFREYVAGIKSK